MREIISLNENWTLSFPKGDHVTEQVNLPHTWNAVDGNDGNGSYLRTTGVYITKINVSNKTLVFKSDEVMTIQHTDYAACHLGVITYVPNSKVKYMECPDDADVIINNDLELKAKLQMVGLRVEEIPKHLQSNFSHDANAVVAMFTFRPNQRVPAWVMSNRLPVRVRINKLSAMLDPIPLPMYTIPVGENENVKRSNMISSGNNNHQDKTK